MKLVDAAREIFYEQGYHAASLADVAKKARVLSGSLYYFFRTKEALLLAVLDRYEELLFPIVIEPAFSKHKDPLERVFGILDAYRGGLVVTHCKHGCPIGNLVLELADAHPRVRRKLAALFEAWCGWIARCLDDAVATGRLRPGLDHFQISRFVLSVMEGSVMQARAHSALAPFDASIAQLRLYFDGLGGKPKERKHKR